ncbi:hypothetical protein [Nocardia sp. NPDC047038]|uniref:hypothetical protein n=1 Tax=Nocardia sp. NPDC047038 TaxID=3154338 RepID=UPI00340062DC
MAVTQKPGIFAAIGDAHPHVFGVNSAGALWRWTGKDNKWLNFGDMDFAQVPIAMASRNRDWLIGWTRADGQTVEQDPPPQTDGDDDVYQPEGQFVEDALPADAPPPEQPDGGERVFDLIDTVLGNLFNKTIIHLFAMGRNGTLYCRYFDGYNWSPAWTVFGTGFAPVSPCVAVRRGKLNVFAVRPNGDVLERYNDGHNWSPGWTTFARNATTAAAVHVRDKKKINLLAPTTNDGGRVYERYFDGYNWSPWKPFGPNIDARTPASFGRMQPMLVDGNGYVRDRYWDGYNWSPNWGRPANSGVVTPVRPVHFERGVPKQKYIYVRGMDGCIWEYYQGSGGWLAPKQWSTFTTLEWSPASCQYTRYEPGFESGGIYFPSHVSAERVHLFAVDSNGRLRQRRRTNNGWEAWVDRGGDLR